MAEIKIFQFNHFSQNTYLIYDDTKECVLIDPGCYFDEEKDALMQFIAGNKLQLKKVLFTHCHLDHCFGANFIKKTYGDIPFCAHKNEDYFIIHAQEQALRFRLLLEQPPKITDYIEHGDVIEFGSTKLKSIFVPGHSPGSICFYSESDNFIITGDVLFQGSVGRTDLHGGDYDTLISGIKSKLLVLPDNLVCYCGHGPSTTIGYEKQSNPFLS